MAQQLAQVTFNGGSAFSYFSFVTNQGVLIRVSEDGKILEWGTEVLSDRGQFYAHKLQPFLARTDYFDAGVDPSFTGKVKNIGSAMLTYYSSFEQSFKSGKLKSIGPLTFDYYSNFDDEGYRGKIKFIGSELVEYYSSFENEGIRGKIKRIGSTSISYHSFFEDKAIRGKVKSIGPVNYSWYSSFDQNLGGVLKSGNFRQQIGSVTYILQSGY